MATANALLAAACQNGISCLDERSLLIILAQAANAGGGGGGGGAGVNYNLQGVVDPTTAPADPTQTWRWTNTASGSDWVWNTTTQAWQQIV